MRVDLSLHKRPLPSELILGARAVGKKLWSTFYEWAKMYLYKITPLNKSISPYHTIHILYSCTCIIENGLSFVFQYILNITEYYVLMNEIAWIKIDI